MGIADDLFFPSQQHMQHEKQRLDHTYVMEGAADGSNQRGCGPVDLGSGRIVIALQEQHAILPARPKLDEESEGDDAGGDGGPPDLP
ncbi:hypothetical protein DB35_12230 [Streptomyces abyssalis]|uniref:Uncharacterized protein n=1 Tax=Streptomyces abyssalis TaxID=933944 RepID=A0A1E7JH56_9ACTN|nr:hypothetical protein [Streptomyces abyssalis]OEU85808.1 hypothetical protein AN215_25715 [Streptomyces abyssalis]OEU92728.1 hypothetical protein DB35_12230 [Streptomyces abyssalis]